MIVLTGESHLAAVRKGASDRSDVTFWPLGKGGSVATPFFRHDPLTKSVSTFVSGWRNRTYCKDTLTFNGEQAVVGLTMPLNTSRILRDYSWHTHVPWHLQKTDAEFPLSEAVVDAMMAQDYKHALAFVAALQACQIKTVVIEAPHFFEIGRDRRPARLEVRAYIDAHYRATVRTKLGELGADVIDQPLATLTAIGSTKSEFAHENPTDTTHGNTAFGALMFEKIISYGEKAKFLK